MHELKKRSGLTTYSLTDEQCVELAELSRLRILTLEDQATPQERANEFWQRMGTAYGFDWTTVRPDPTTRDRGQFRAKKLTVPATKKAI